MRIVLRVGGSIIASPVNSDLISRYADMLKDLKAHGHEIVVVVGGGKLAREFIATAKSLELNEKAQDEVAISISRVFAQLLLLKLGEIGCKTVPLKTSEAMKCLKAKKVVVMGGIEPGMTTDAAAALIAEKAKADLLIKATDQNGVYNKDPRKHADAVKLDHLRYEDLAKVLAENKHKAGIHQVIDPEAIKILRRKRVKVIVVNGFKPENVMAAVDGKSAGTVID
ncbi:MAG: UMP kinase [Candidatus Bathycorpusculaceae bacterium]